MGLIARVGRPKAMNSEELSRLILPTYGGRMTSTGISVNTESAMRAITVHKCVKAKANALLQIPCHLMKQEGRNKERAIDHRLYTLLHDQPNEWMTAPEFWGMCSACLDLRGNFFVLKSNLPGRPIRELIPLGIGRVQEVIQMPDYSLAYKVSRPTTKQTTSDIGAGNIGDMLGVTYDIIPGNRIMHIRELVLNGYMGLNPIAYARESIGLAIAQEKHGAKLFSHGTLLGGILKWDKHFSTEQKAKEFLTSFNEIYSSVENAHKTALLEDGVTWEKIQMTSQDSQFMEARAFQNKDITDLFFALPLQIMSTGDKTATFASAEQFDKEYVQYAIMPRIVNIEKAIRRDLLTEEEKQTPYYAKFQAQALLRGTTKDRFEAYQIGINTEIINPNEARDLEDMNPYDGGDEYRTRTATMKQADDGKEKKGADNAAQVQK
jgi:HK97 family phage portal protein